MIVPGILVCSSFLISVCMFIVSKALLISSATVIVRTGGVIWLNPFATVLFNVCSAVTVECCVLTRVAWVCLLCFLLCTEEDSSPVSLQLLRGGILACIRRALVYVFVGFWDRDYVLFGETIRNMFGCGCYFVFECYGCV